MLMVSVMSYNICALILEVVILFVTIYKKHLDLIQHRTFIKLACILIACSGFSAEAKYMSAFPMVYSAHAIRIMVFLTTLFDLLFPFGFAVYCMSVFDRDFLESHRNIKVALLVPLFAEIYILLFQSGNTMMFTCETDLANLSGKGTVIFGVVNLYFIIFALLYTIKFRKAVEGDVILSLYAASGFIFLGTAANVISEDFITGDIFYAIGLVIVRMLNQRSQNYIDLMTKIPNANAFLRCFEINRKTHMYNELFILYVENLRLLNLTVGYSRINTVIEEIAAFLDELTGHEVFYFETGTFILMPKLLPSERESFFHKLRDRFTSTWSSEGSDLLVSMRIMEVKLPADADSIDKICSCADHLRNIKGSTADHFYASEIAFRNTEHILFLENCIKRAIEEHNFKVYYQPIYSTAEKRIISAEALIRLIDPKHGFISPAEFIPVSEENGSIIQIGHFVLENVFDFIAMNDFKELGLDYVEINLSVVQCMQRDLASTISKMADERGVDSLCVNLEITETAAAERPLMLMKNMKHLIEQKYTFSLDDFGTGYSNISSMMDMPLEIIKFDKSIIDRLLHGEDGKILVESLAAMVKKMGKKIVAEGVETKEQLDSLESVGVDYIQGFYFSKPLPAEDFVKFVADFNAPQQEASTA